MFTRRMDVKNNICKKTPISDDLIVIGRKKMYAGLLILQSIEEIKQW